MNQNADYEALIREISKCCLSENECSVCEKEACLIGYCKQGIITCLKQEDDFLDGAFEGIPYGDMKVYDNERLITTMAFLLHQCRNCSVYHDEECIINIVRASLEVILLGDAQEYRGSILMYLNDIKNVNEAIANDIFVAFQQSKEQESESNGE